LKEEIMEGKTGFVFKPQDAKDLASRIEDYFQSDLYKNIETERRQIKQYANDRYSWQKVAAIITSRYADLLHA
jgi:glycosyltransferase involved in cell wall biosynthesis